VLIPSLYAPYVRIPTSKVELAFSCVPASLEVELVTRYAQLRQVDLAVQPRNAINRTVAYTLALPQSTTVAGTMHLSVAPEPVQLTAVSQAMQKPGDGANVIYTLLFDRIPAIDLQSVRVTSQQGQDPVCMTLTYQGAALVAVAAHGATLMRYKLLQEELSNLVLGFNNSIANLLLGGMVVAFLWFTYLALSASVQLYLGSDQSVLKRLDGRFGKAPHPVRIKGKRAFVSTEFTIINRRLTFAKAVGPAFGFLLTVSSLSAALHPSVQAAQDTFRFVSGIQIAVIATFVGLAIRIAAQVAQRSYRSLAERLLSLAADNTHAATGGP
jgi:hypothetical protein